LGNEWKGTGVHSSHGFCETAAAQRAAQNLSTFLRKVSGQRMERNRRP